MLAGVGLQKDAPLFGADDDRSAPGRERAQCRVACEPFRDPGTAPLEALIAGAHGSVDRRPTTPGPAEALRSTGSSTRARQSCAWRPTTLSHLQGLPLFSVRPKPSAAAPSMRPGPTGSASTWTSCSMSSSDCQAAPPTVERPGPAHRPVQEDRPTGENRASYILGAWALGRTARPRRFGRWNLQRKGIGLPSLAMPVR